LPATAPRKWNITCIVTDDQPAVDDPLVKKK